MVDVKVKHSLSICKKYQKLVFYEQFSFTEPRNLFQPQQLVPSVAARWQCGRRKTWMGRALARGVAVVGASSIDGCSARGGRTRQHSVLLSVHTDGVRCPRLCGAADNVITVCQCCGHAGVSEVLCWVLRKTRSWRRCSAGWDWSSRSSLLCCCWSLPTTWRSPSLRPLFKVVSLLGVMYLRGSSSPLSPHHASFTLRDRGGLSDERPLNALWADRC